MAVITPPSIFIAFIELSNMLSLFSLHLQARFFNPDDDKPKARYPNKETQTKHTSRAPRRSPAPAVVSCGAETQLVRASMLR